MGKKWKASLSLACGLLGGCLNENPSINDPLLHLAPNLTLSVTNRSGLDGVTVAVDGPCEDLGTFVLNDGGSAREKCGGSIGSEKVWVRATKASAGYDHYWERVPLPSEYYAGLDFSIVLTTGGIHASVN